MEVLHSVSTRTEEESSSYSYLDDLPDHLLLLIFNRVIDAKSLTRCLAVSKRFASFVHQSDVVSLSLASCRPPRNCRPNPRGLSVNFFKSLVNKLITQPLQFLHHRVVFPKSNLDSHSHRLCPFRVLSNFNGIKSLHLELPDHGGALSTNTRDCGPFLKWNANFGTDLKSCAIFCANTCQPRLTDSYPKLLDQQQGQEQEQSSGPMLTNEELKSRIVWTISCLIAASTRHYWIKQIVSKIPKLQKLEITDSGKQGKFVMEEEDLSEVRDFVNENTCSSSSLVERSVIPDLRMKMWYAKELELPGSGWVIKGATLVMIRPSWKMINEKGFGNGGLEFDGDEAEKVMVGRAVREMVKTKNYVLEMTPF